MGYFPIFLYLAGFLLLFIMVVSNHLVNKKKQYLRSLEELAVRLQELHSKTNFTTPNSLAEAERYYQSLKASADNELLNYINQSVKPLITKARLQLHWYNKLIMTRPYSFVARITGHSAI